MSELNALVKPSTVKIIKVNSLCGFFFFLYHNHSKAAARLLSSKTTVSVSLPCCSNGAGQSATGRR